MIDPCKQVYLVNISFPHKRLLCRKLNIQMRALAAEKLENVWLMAQF